MSRILINATHPGEVRVATMTGPFLEDLDIEQEGLEQKKANIYKGTITRLEPSLAAAFVDYGSERHGFLPLKEISHEYFFTQDEETIASGDIQKLLKVGQELVVQVDKEERGNKGAALTTYISLAGRFIVLMPNNPRAGGISRRIEGEDREQMKDIISSLPVPEGMGVIIRTAGVGKNKEELDWDLKVLLRYWEAIKQAAIAKPGPYLIHQESDALLRAIRDHLLPHIKKIYIDEENAYKRARDYLSRFRPDFLPNVELYQDYLPLFSRFQVEQQIETAYQRVVHLPSGGSIVIDHSEALIAIDINSSRATKGSNIEETARNTNLEAAEEIARQLRIRDIGGLVVIDFIDMTQTRHQREVENRLRDALRMDRARIQVGRISRFGLLEMSRQRLRASLNTATHVTCPNCEGRGIVRSVESLALSIIHLVQENAAKAKDTVYLQVQLPVDVATYILNEKRDVIYEIEKKTNVKVGIIPNIHLQSPHYYIKQVNPEESGRGKGVASYQLSKTMKAEPAEIKKPGAISTEEEPVISQYLLETMGPAPRKPSSGLIKRLWTIMFGSEDATPTAEQAIKKEKPTPTTTAEKKYTQPRQRMPQKQSQGQGRAPSEKGGYHKQAKSMQKRSRRGTRGGNRRRPPQGPQQRDPMNPHQHQSFENKPEQQKSPVEKDFSNEMNIQTENHPVTQTHEQPKYEHVHEEQRHHFVENSQYKGFGYQDKALQQVTTKHKNNDDESVAE